MTIEDESPKTAEQLQRGGRAYRNRKEGIRG
mgnify:CR=1 FL=1|jgi:hypothetical protein